MRNRWLFVLVLIGFVTLFVGERAGAATCGSACTSTACSFACNGLGSCFTYSTTCISGQGYCVFECGNGLTVYVSCTSSCGGGGGSPVFKKHE